MDKTGISWTQSDDGKAGATWNPTDGCEVCSPGCKNCYAMRMAGRFSGPGKPYEGLVTIGKDKKARWNGEGRLNRKALCKPLRWKAPRRVFVNSMSDLFFERFTDEEIEEVFTVMALAPRHTFQILTKRATRMRQWFWRRPDALGTDIRGRVIGRAWEWLGRASSGVPRMYAHEAVTMRPWPLPNAWMGVSVDDRKHGLPRIDELRDVPAAVRFLSIEPLLEDLGQLDLRGIHWVIVGCESGPGARPMGLDWVRSIRDQALAAGAAFFLKQAVANYHGACTKADCDPSLHGVPQLGPGNGSSEHGRGHGGRVIELPYLDGVQHRAFPKAA